MRLFYTGAVEPKASQTNPIISIGGYVSCSKVPSGLVGSIFANPSQSEMQKGGVIYILLSLKNLTGGDLTDTKVFYEQADDALYTIEMGLIAPATNSCGEPVYEEQVNNGATPLDVVFTDAKNIGNAINISSLVADAHMGVWIKRTMSADAADTFLSCDSLLLAHDDPNHASAKKEFPFDVKISY